MRALFRVRKLRLKLKYYNLLPNMKTKWVKIKNVYIQ